MIWSALIEGFLIAIVGALIATPVWILMGYEQAVAVLFAFVLLAIVGTTLRDTRRF